MEEKIINYNELKFEILNEKPKIVIALKSKKNFSKVNETNKKEILNNLFSLNGYKDFNQNHGTNIFNHDEKGQKNYDGFFLAEKKKAMGLKTADCIPLFLWNKKVDKVFGLHCGWKGIVSGIIEKVLSSDNGKDLAFAFLGPHVSQANFEVQKDLISALERANFDTSKALVEEKQAFYLSLRELCRQKLEDFSVEIINKKSECSYEKKDKLFSWLPFTYPFNLTKNPSCSLNVGFSKLGLPIGMQIVADVYKDKICFDLAYFIEQLIAISDTWPTLK